MHEKFAISDTHFLHANVLKFMNGDSKLRPFNSLEEMHEYMIQKWNSVVRPQDYVYHLGDVTFQYNDLFNNIMSRLNGHKRLIVGNHDKIKNPALHIWFDKILLWRGWREHNFTMSHMPLKKGHFRDGEFNVHGHVHAHSLAEPEYINVSVEVRDYTPVHFDEILAEIKRK